MTLIRKGAKQMIERGLGGMCSQKILISTYSEIISDGFLDCLYKSSRHIICCRGSAVKLYLCSLVKKNAPHCKMDENLILKGLLYCKKIGG